jgi:hypothetical protein
MSTLSDSVPSRDHKKEAETVDHSLAVQPPDGGRSNVRWKLKRAGNEKGVECPTAARHTLQSPRSREPETASGYLLTPQNIILIKPATEREIADVNK